MIADGSPQRKSTTASVLADSLRNAIVDGSLTGGQPLRQDEIASRYGVSKIPVREALVQLQSEGLVTFQPSRGAAVSILTPQQAEEIYVMRFALETTVLRRAIPQMDRQDFLEAEHLLRKIDDEDNPLRWGELNWTFHQALYKPANMPLLMDTLQKLWVNVTRYFVVYQATAYRHKSQTEHHDILTACRAGNVDAASFYLEHHLRSAANNMIRHLKEQQTA